MQAKLGISVPLNPAYEVTQIYQQDGIQCGVHTCITIQIPARGGSLDEP